MGHGHGHGTVTGAHRSRLGWVLAISVLVLVAEVLGALVSSSLALLADAGHVLTDVVGVSIALTAATLAQRAPSTRRTFGWQRLEVLAACANALLLVGVCVYIFVEGIRRLAHPAQVATDTMLLVAVLGLVANAVALALLRPAKDASLNVRGAYLEVLGDLLGSVAVIVAALVIRGTGWLQADAVASIVLASLVVPRAWTLLRDALDVLLETTPRGVELADVREHMLSVPGVVDVHDLHAWTITSGLPVLSAHVVVDEPTMGDPCGASGVLDNLGRCLAGHFDVEHCTFQLEPHGHAEHERSMHS